MLRKTKVWITRATSKALDMDIDLFGISYVFYGCLSEVYQLD